MSYLRAQHVFYLLMGLSAVVAFLVPEKYAARFQPQMQWAFAPVSRPVGAMASAINRRVAPPLSDDLRADATVKFENLQLRAEVAQLQTQLNEVNRRQAELAKLGSARQFCSLFKVVGGDSGPRDSLAIAGSTLQGVKDSQFVLYPGGMVGQIQRAGTAGAQVHLLTDPGAKIQVRFGRFMTSNGAPRFEPLGTPAVVAQGIGNGLMAVRDISLATIGYDAKGKPIGNAGEALREGTDYAVVFDSEYPEILQGEIIGRIVSIAPRADARLFAEIQIRPTASLTKLREVMVMTREPGE
jgi:cell shape-determining protein MreC